MFRLLLFSKIMPCNLCFFLVVQCLRCGVQFLGNAVAGFEESKIIVWQAIFNIIR